MEINHHGELLGRERGREGDVCARGVCVCARVCVYCVHVFLTGSHCVALTQESLCRPGWPPTYKTHLPLSLESRIKSVPTTPGTAGYP